jgi:hypothetical protein
LELLFLVRDCFRATEEVPWGSLVHLHILQVILRSTKVKKRKVRRSMKKNNIKQFKSHCFEFF